MALRNGVNEMYALVMGVMTATFGGLLADLLCNAIPNLLKKGELYATACAIGGVAYLIMKKTALEQNASLLLCIIIIIAVRILSKRKKWSLPAI
jgi:uncharacterized membrane protein YeiH